MAGCHYHSTRQLQHIIIEEVVDKAIDTKASASDVVNVNDKEIGTINNIKLSVCTRY